MAFALFFLANMAVLLVDSQSVQAHGRYYRNYRNHHYRNYRNRLPSRYCYPVTKWIVAQDPADHPQAYADGYRQGQNHAKKGKTYQPRTAGGEFGRGFDDGFYDREFAGQQRIIPNVVKPYITKQCY
ncbi:hypothetical protein [Nostoc sp. LEGE 06077]|uniref:hypothetical protein n=1 Tax=Nostoc sp. LEGE 06077 TaxID=915325 RepID=UPI001D146139|nr:hypothetical protein [Nostoc sp. LEGE 06077]